MVFFGPIDASGQAADDDPGPEQRIEAAPEPRPSADAEEGLPSERGGDSPAGRSLYGSGINNRGVWFQRGFAFPNGDAFGDIMRPFGN